MTKGNSINLTWGDLRMMARFTRAALNKAGRDVSGIDKFMEYSNDKFGIIPIIEEGEDD